MLIKLLFFVACISFTYAHICIIEPIQRGPISIEQPGDPTCFLRTGYCGGVEFNTVKTSYFAGSKINFLFQQNLNHWWQQDPGYFDIAISYNTSPQENDWKILSKFSDWVGNEMVWQQNFSIPITIPQQTSDHAILRLRYVSNNPEEIYPASNTQAIFYNCADIKIVENPLPSNVADHQQENGIPEESIPSKIKLTSNLSDQEKIRLTEQYSCESSKQWIAEGQSFSSTGIVKHKVIYDPVHLFVRWEREGEVELSGQNMKLNTLTNYTSGVEYVWYPETKTCFRYGGDYFYKWGFGKQNAMEFVSVSNSTTTGDIVTWKINNPYVFNDDWIYTNQVKNCLPNTIHHQDFTLQFHQIDLINISPNSHYLQPPSYCAQSEFVIG